MGYISNANAIIVRIISFTLSLVGPGWHSIKTEFTWGMVKLSVIPRLFYWFRKWSVT